MSLSTNLAAAWELTEASGNALDSVGSETLTDTNTVTSGTGLVNATARLFTKANSEYFTVPDDALMSTGDIDFTFEAWVNPTTLSGTTVILSKWNATAANQEYIIFFSNLKPQFSVNNSSGASTNAIWGSNLSTGAWYQLIGWHDSVNNQIGFTVNNGTPVTTAYSVGVRDGVQAFQIGASSTQSLFWDGLTGPVRFWKNRVLSAADRTELFNSGAGRTYSYIAGGASGGPWPWFTDNELSGGLQHLGM